jgi:hypothetical protein
MKQLLDENNYCFIYAVDALQKHGLVKGNYTIQNVTH